MSVSTTHPIYNDFVPIWKRTYDCAEGEPRIKDGKTIYLPAQFYEDTDRYDLYLQRAYFLGATKQALASIVGMVMRKPATYNFPSKLEELAENIDGSERSIAQMAKYSLNEVGVKGRIGYLADYPNAPTGITKEQQRTGGYRPYMKAYTAESIVNWREEVINGRNMLTMVVLMELVNKDNENEFSHDTKKQYRVLRLRDGVYTQQVYDDDSIPSEEFEPRMGGAKIDHIPFYFAGTENNQPDCDMPLMYEIATLDIAYYQTTADHRENLHQQGQITVGVATEYDPVTWNEANPDGFKVGARTVTNLGPNGSFSAVSVPAITGISAELDYLKQTIIGAGGKIIQKSGQAETAEATRINASAQSSMLETMVSNISEAMRLCLKDVAGFMSESQDIEFNLNQDFFEGSLDANIISAVTGLQAIGTIAKRDARYMLRNGRIGIEEGRTDEEIDLDIASEVALPDVNADDL
tara:strand:- start:1956 stop:3353 length:1398 start_codon:yes stop_codon:yes gene_type:complete